MPRIQVLSDLLVNKIAAGEVIERPSSVVKELVENSIDAGAGRIDIDIEDGGRRLIRVVDDGAGMGPDDLALSIRPHATSKISTEEDLFGIRTMGFRGEALPSIGAVSQLRVVSRLRSADAAHEVRVLGERVEPLAAAAAPPGTTVEVRQLFFNVPARQKFLRTAQTEMGHISEQLARIALVHPHVEFRLTHNGRLVHHLRSSDGMRPRVGDFYGREMSAALLEVAREERGLRITGLAAAPADSRSSAKWQYIFLNGRYIRDRFIAHALREAYRGLIDPNRYPVVFLALDIDPAAVDVNVHPTKIEVRWRDSNLVYSQVLSALRDRFLNTDLTPALLTDRASGAGLVASDGYEGATPELLQSETAAAAPADPAEARRLEIRASIAEFFKRSRLVTPGDAPYNPLPAGTGAGTLPVSPRLAESFPPGSPQTAGWEPLASSTFLQVHRTYLVTETPDGMIIIDQHALHERILFEQLSQSYARGPLESQRMLIPDTIDVTPEHVAVIETYADTLHHLGLELTPYGPSTIAIHAAPTLLRDERVRDFVRDLLDRLVNRAAPASPELLMNDLLSMMACKAAVKAGDPLTPEEIRALMSQRDRVDRSSNCPHGRPTSLRLTLRDLEKQFKRA